MPRLTLRIPRGTMSSGEIQISAGMKRRTMYLKKRFQSFLAAEQAFWRTQFRLGLREGQREGCEGEPAGALNGKES